MSQSVKVPDPVYEAIEREAERSDVPRGVVVEGWMEAAGAGEEDDTEHVAVCGCGHVTEPRDDPAVALINGIGHLDKGCRSEHGVTVKKAEDVLEGRP